MLAFILIFFSLKLSAAEPYETRVTASRIEQSPDQMADDFTVITRDEIQKANAINIETLLQKVTGLQVTDQGGFGHSTTVFVRGANGSHTLVLLDGVPLNDPGSPDRSFDFANFSMEEIEQIEILRGPQSVLYGSDAIAGVINIVTVKPNGPMHLVYNALAGSYQTTAFTGGVQAGNGPLYYSMSAGQISTRGFPAADEQLGNSLPDGSQLGSFNARVGGKIADNVGIDGIVRYSDLMAALDQRGGPGADDPNYSARARQSVYRLQAKAALFGGLWEIVPQASYVQIDRGDQNNPDLLSPNFLYDDYHSKTQKYSLQNNLKFSDEETLIVAGESLVETAESITLTNTSNTQFPREMSSTNSIFLENIWTPSIFFVTGGIRSDTQSRFGSFVTYKIAPGLKIPSTQTRLRSAAATGFKSPSLYQLYSLYGATTLQAENSTSWELGFDQPIGDLSVSGTYFNTNYRNLIDFDYIKNQYQNIAGTNTQGIEADLSYKILPDLGAKVNYTYLDAIDANTHQMLLRRARNSYGASVDGKFFQDLSAQIYGTWLSERDDVDPLTFVRVTLPGYVVCGASATYEIRKNLQLYARADNIFDRIYEEVDGFGTPRRSYYIGIRGE